MTKTSLRSLFLVILCILGPVRCNKKGAAGYAQKIHIDSTEVYPHVCNESMSMFVMFKKKTFTASHIFVTNPIGVPG
jgi:hypothetical protein